MRRHEDCGHSRSAPGAVIAGSGGAQGQGNRADRAWPAGGPAGALARRSAQRLPQPQTLSGGRRPKRGPPVACNSGRPCRSKLARCIWTPARLAKIYVQEPDSDALDAALTGRRDLLISELALTELTAALARRMREGQVDAAAGRRIYQQLLRDVRAGEYRLLDLTSATHREAERLLLTLGRHAPLRAADSLHLAAAALADDRALVTYDRLLHAAALAMGAFEVVPSPVGSGPVARIFSRSLDRKPVCVHNSIHECATGIEFADEAVEEMKPCVPTTPRESLDAIEASLRHEPMRISRQRRPVYPIGLPTKVRNHMGTARGEYRVFYDVEGNGVIVIRIVRKGRRTTEESLT